MNDTRKFKRKIAFFVPNLYGGGAQRVFVNLANQFASRGFNTDLVLIKNEGVYRGFVNAKVKVVDLKCKKAFLSVLPLIKYIEKNEPAVLLASIDAACIVAALAKIFSRVKFRLLIRQAYYFSSPKRFKKKIVGLLLKKSYAQADSIIVLTKNMRDDILKKFNALADKIFVIYNPVDLSCIEADSMASLEHSWFTEGKGGKFKLILAAGVLRQIKGFDCLIRAFHQIKKREKIKLIILGSGRDKKKLESLAQELGLEDDISLPGFVDNPFAYMRKADVFVLSSFFEGCPNVILEAMCCGAPIVSTDCPSGPSEILENGKYGRLVPVGDVSAMARAIIETLDNPLPPGFLRKRAEDFGIEKVADRYLDVMFPDLGCDL